LAKVLADIGEVMTETEKPDLTGQVAGVTVKVMLKPRARTKRPPMYKVLLLNDDYTPMEFVIEILIDVFHKSQEEATRIVSHVHQRGVGVCGVFTHEVAETKVAQVMGAARRAEHPLKCTLEKE